MLWYNNPDSVEAIRNGRMEQRTTVRMPRVRLVRHHGDITAVSG